jgi:uncharacterized repeat protein (TIGR03803 family)
MFASWWRGQVHHKSKNPKQRSHARFAPSRFSRLRLETLEARTLPSIVTLASFNGSNGDSPIASLIEDSSGNLFGTTDAGGTFNNGTVFEVAAGSGSITTLASFNGSNGAVPFAGLIEDSSGNLFGTTREGGTSNSGTVFEVVAGSGSITTLASFNGFNGAIPSGGLVEDGSGNLFGTTFEGLLGFGNVFEVAAGSGSITTLAWFDGSSGVDPIAGLVEDGSGNLFGTTFGGGRPGPGTVFEVVAGSGSITTLASFNGSNGADPFAGLVEDRSGNLFGTTREGGTSNNGTVFEVAAGSGSITTLASFNGANGADPFAGLVEDRSGNLFGTTREGGASNIGTVFEVAAGSGSITTLESFDGSNGANPYAGLVEDVSGNLFGTASGGGSGYGTVFEIPRATSTAITAPTVTYNSSGQVTVTVTSASGTPTGNVALTVDGGSPITQALANGASTFSLSGLHAGVHSLSATYSAQNGLAASSGTGTLTVNPYSFNYTIGNDSQTYGTPANFAVDLGTTIDTGVNGENLAISYSSAGDTAAASTGTYPISGTLASGSGLASDYNVTLTPGTLTVTFRTATWTGMAGDGNWDTAGNWSTGSVPGVGDEAFIPSGFTVTHDHDQVQGTPDSVFSVQSQSPIAITAGSLTIAASSAISALVLDSDLAVAGTLTVSGTLDWQGGTLTGGGTLTVAAGGTLSIDNPVYHVLDGATLTNQGTATWTSGHIQLDDQAVFNNSGTLTMALSDNWRIYYYQGTAGAVNNSGTWIDAGTGQTNYIGELGTLPFNNSGALEVQSGTLDIVDGGTSSGSFDVAAGTDLLLISQVLTATSRVTGAGQLDWYRSTVGGWYNVTGTTNVDGDVVDFTGTVASVGQTLTINTAHSWPTATANFEAQALSVPNLNISGTLSDSVSVVVTAAMDWQGGTLTGGGTLTVAAGGTLSIDNPVYHVLDGATLTNQGTATWTSGHIQLDDQAVFNNSGTLTMALSDNWRIYYYQGTAAGAVNNSGTWIDAGTGQTNYIGELGTLPFNNSGALEVQSGTLDIVDGGTTSGSFDGDTGTSLVFGGSSLTFAPTSAIHADTLSLNPTYLNVQISGPTRGVGFLDINANSITIGGQLNLALLNGFTPNAGDTFTILHGTGSAAINGTFAGLAQGAYVSAGTAEFQISYQGEGGKDVLLTYLGNLLAVTNTSDSGPGSLRQAINQVNTSGTGSDTITFTIPTSDPGYNPTTGAFTIRPLSLLPTIQHSVLIDGFTQPGATPNDQLNGGDAVLKIELNGTLLPKTGVGLGTYGLKISAGNSTVRGLVVNRFIDAFPSVGIWLAGAGNDVIQGDYLGTDVTGTSAFLSAPPTTLSSNIMGYAVFLDSTTNNLIGTDGDGAHDAGERNVIDGCDFGVAANIAHGPVSGNVIAGNFIGTNAAGTAVLGNFAGIGTVGDTADRIGTTGSGAYDADRANVISGNYYGVLLGAQGTVTAPVSAVQVTGNFIGTDITGHLALGNRYEGIGINGASLIQVGGTSAGMGNVIAFSGSNGLYLLSNNGHLATGAVIQGNFIHDNSVGVLLSGAPNNTIGGTLAGARNVISGNSGDGVQLTGAGSTNNLVEGNYIGLNAAGTAVIANGGDGIHLLSGANHNTIGGTVNGAGNLISGNVGNGVNIADSGTSLNVVEGNYVGTDVTGSNILSNRGNGILIQHGASANTVGGWSSLDSGTGHLSGAGNLIAGNLGSGVQIVQANGNSLEGDFIGTDILGQHALGNDPTGNYDDVDVFDSSNTTIGGLSSQDSQGNLSGLGNLISGTTFGTCVWITDALTDFTTYGGSPSTNNVVEGNFVGTNVNGTASLANGNGVALDAVGPATSLTDNTIGGSTAGLGNVITSKFYGKVFLGGSGAARNLVEGNRIGTNAAGTAAIANNSDGVEIVSGANHNTIGGTTDLARNLISGNSLNGVKIAGATTTANVVEGNYIGTTATGDAAVPNGGNGVLISNSPGNLVGGSAGAREVISGNNGDGVLIVGTLASGNLVQGNYIGTSYLGTAAIPNVVRGVEVFNGASGNTIGVYLDSSGVLQGAGNVIAGNGTSGSGDALNGGSSAASSGNVQIISASFNSIAGNILGLNKTGTGTLNVLSTTDVRIYAGASYNRVGADGTATASDAAERNIISGAYNVGVVIADTGSNYNVVAGNYIGTDITGTYAIPNGDDGVLIKTGAHFTRIGTNGTDPDVAGERNVISGNGIASQGSLVIGAVTLQDDATGTTIAGNYIGTDFMGSERLANYAAGIVNQSTTGVTMGGATAGMGNLLSGNGTYGIILSVGGNTVQGNLIGTDVSGNHALANGAGGIEVASANNTVGGTTAGARNVISGNFPAPGYGDAIDIYATGNLVEGNFIGTNAAGTASLSNWGGIVLWSGANGNTIGGASAVDASTGKLSGAGNLISGNGGGAIWMTQGATGNALQGNFIGTDVTGKYAIPNDSTSPGYFAVSINASGNLVGGASSVDAQGNLAGLGNLISGNGGPGVGIYGGISNVLVQGNAIGTDVSGIGAIGNGGDGVMISGASYNTIGGTTVAARNVIAGNWARGIDVIGGGASHNVIEGNYVGISAAGTAALGNAGTGVAINDGAGNVVGGVDPGAANVISGNAHGVGLGSGATNTLVEGNFIGTDPTGSYAIGNASDGIISDSGANGSTISSNVIAGNFGPGIFLIGIVGDQLVGNWIGTNAVGAPLGNAGDGVLLTGGASNNTIGAPQANAGNTIAFNSLDGVFVDSGTGNSIRGNSIHDNGGLGIRLNAANSANNNLAAPFVASAFVSSSGTRITGWLAGGAASTAGFLDFYANVVPDASGFGEGQTYLGQAPVQAGQTSFQVTLPVLATPGQFMTATVTDSIADTSQFAGNASILLPVATTTTVTPSVNPSVLYQAVTLTATVMPTAGNAIATGSVQFQIDHINSGSPVTLSGGSASLSATTLSAGTHTITAIYNGDYDFLPSTGTLNQQVSATPLLENGVLAIPGTAVPAVFTLTPVLPTGASSYSMKVVYTIGTTTTNLGTFAVSSGLVAMYGGPGTDSVTLAGTASYDAFAVGSGTVTELAAQGTAQGTNFSVALNAITALTLKGGAKGDSLTGPNQANAWAITGSNSGILNGSTTFSRFAALIGGANADTFSFVDGGSVSGTIDGGGGSDTLDFSARSSAVTVTLLTSGTNKATATGGWKGIATVIGSANTADNLVGPDTSNAWTINGLNSGTLNGSLAFAGFENVTGGSLDDTFAFLPNGSISGSLKGGAGTDVLDYSAYGSAVTIDVAAKRATGIGGTWANFTTVIGAGTASTIFDTIPAGTTWNLAGQDAGMVGGISFSAFGNLSGGPGNDTFKFADGASVSGIIDGQGGVNTLDYSLFTANMYANLQTLTASGTGGILGIQNVTGGQGTDILVGDANDNVLLGKGSRNVIIGGGGNDALTAGSGGDILLAGVTDYDTNVAALNALMAAWARTDQTYAQRVAALQTGVVYSDGTGTHTAMLTTATVRRVGSGTSTLKGGAGLDWYFAGLADIIKNKTNQETLTTLL